MLTNIAVRPKSVADAVAVPPRPAAAARLIQTLQQHGSLLVATDQDASAIVRALQTSSESDPRFRQQLTALVVSLRQQKRFASVRGSHSLDSPLSPDEVVAQTASWADIVSVEASLLSGQPGAPKSPELLAFEDLRDSLVIQDLDKFAGIGHLPRGSERETFWNRVLMPLARVSTMCTIVDTYLLKRMGSGREPTHVTWLLSRLAKSMSPQSTVELIAGFPDDTSSTRDILTRILRYQRDIAPGIRLRLCLNEKRVLPHDRHIRFSCGAAVKIPAGFDRLSGREIWDPDGMSWEYHWRPEAVQAYKKTEQRCLTDRGAEIAEATT